VISVYTSALVFLIIKLVCIQRNMLYN